MASNSTVSPLLNPLTPLVFLSPTIAEQYQTSCYINIAVLAAYAWDWLLSLSDEYQILRKARLCPKVAYFLSRFGTLGACIISFVPAVISIEHCQLLVDIQGAFFMLSIAATSLLFFLRIRAVYDTSKCVAFFFGFLWVAILGLSTLFMFAFHGEHIPHTQRCIESSVRAYSTVPSLLAVTFDTLGFLAISYRIISCSMVGHTWHARVNSFVKGEGLHGLSKALLQSGQLYYFATVGLSVGACTLILAPGVPNEFHMLLWAPYLALSSSMACRVFRAVLLGTIEDPQISTTDIILIFRNTPAYNFSIAAGSSPDVSPQVLAETDLTVEGNNVTEDLEVPERQKDGAVMDASSRV